MTVRILVGDVRAKLAELDSGSVQCVVTSPPYFGLRKYLPIGHEDERHELGLESTLAEYLATMVDVFRDVRRVLRDDGVLWLNIGDSYAQSHARGATSNGDHDVIAVKGFRESSRYTESATVSAASAGLKPKDLMMVPARLAIALQEPYYTGRIKDESDRIWLAAMIDAEGCMFIHKRKIGQNNGQGYARKSDSYGSGLEVANTSKAVVQRRMEIAGQGSICTQGPEENGRRKQKIFRWNMRSNECREIIREVYPYLVAKKHQARLLIGCPSSGPSAEAAHESLKALHNGDEPSIDFAEPESMYEPGWFVRSDIIWAKKNCMPESVTDRPTSSHEHIFLLSKSRTYYYDADAVAERLADTNAQSNRAVVDTRERYGTGGGNEGLTGMKRRMLAGEVSHRTMRNVWNISTHAFPEAHFATFPPEIPRRCIKAGTSEKGACADCGAPWMRCTDRIEQPKDRMSGKGWLDSTEGIVLGRATDPNGGLRRDHTMGSQTTGWAASCACDAEIVPCKVLDPFAGSGTTGLVGEQLERDSILIELNESYAQMSHQRIYGASPLFAKVDVA